MLKQEIAETNAYRLIRFLAEWPHICFYFPPPPLIKASYGLALKCIALVAFWTKTADGLDRKSHGIAKKQHAAGEQLLFLHTARLCTVCVHCRSVIFSSVLIVLNCVLAWTGLG
jgi:hypothetical protein